MSTSHPQHFLDQLEQHFDTDPLLPYALVVESAARQIDKALDPVSGSEESLSDVITKAKVEIRTLTTGE